MLSEHELDLKLAAQLQAALLPDSCPLECEHQIAGARNRMCGSVGGDFYDFIRINNDQIVLLIGDVVGHGVSASLVMAQIMGYLRSRPPILSRPREVIIVLNRMLMEMGERTGSILPCSLFYAVIDAPTGASFFVNAGHCQPFICDREKCLAMHLGPGNLLLGVEEYDPEQGCHGFEIGQRMILYTDGLTDANDADGNHFGEGRLHEVINARAADDPDQCADAIFQAVADFRRNAIQTDDETVVVIDRV